MTQNENGSGTRSVWVGVFENLRLAGSGLIKVGLYAGGLFLLLMISLSVYFYNKIESSGAGILGRISWAADYWQVPFLLMPLCTWLAWHLVSSPFSKRSLGILVGALTATMLCGMFVDYKTEDERLIGKYMCEPAQLDGVAFYQKQKLCQETKEDGWEITRENLPVALNVIKKGKSPEPVDISLWTIEALENGKLTFFGPTGKSLYAKGSTSNADGMPRIFSRLGIDPANGEQLTPFGKDDIKSFTSSLKEKRSAAEKANEKQKAIREAAEEKTRKLAQEEATKKAKEAERQARKEAKNTSLDAATSSSTSATVSSSSNGTLLNVLNIEFDEEPKKQFFTYNPGSYSSKVSSTGGVTITANPSRCPLDIKMGIAGQELQNVCQPGWRLYVPQGEVYTIENDMVVPITSHNFKKK